MKRNLALAFIVLASLSVAAPKVEQFYKAKTGHVYHKDGCRYLKKSKIAVSDADIKRLKLTPCKVCKP